ncbi:hypothetical protein CGMCC3_g9243 [Colletotrichum fructicola]|uniref:Uncharacterized protein n=1 Tax=Colletotrichum fructicola (strain Nara gc5) TaxID=1213859 RepID=A0A7J6JMZ6_COLFN|nr:uncharacterized protein CGMCC3_g9243 [Colletotrichum fructicola]KAF4491788.1 hypothetical protein CGGC5_v000298 [Colletotrichum fructicola Nara gc5]KAI8286542.1 hypothetical protein K4K60_000333 [Colletotrichum sp. SAR11_57]KAE9574758.1 hypothetical protein CGMCC3_g9243 [Colletotrichum fructicola]KAF4432821.1 hypothetical protein CFRS1_v007943 [Colletotrichum fructicola]KAF4899047.1 hypothetical protein CGCFRS4_v004084 [Colletotrichum fructicola]
MRSLPLLLLFFLNRLALAAGKANAFELVVTYNAYKMLWQMNGDAQKLIYPLVGLDGKPIKNNEGTDIGGQLSFEEFVCRYTNQRKCKISLNPDNPVRTGELLGTKYSKSARIPDMRGVPREQLIAAIEIDDTKVKPDTKLYNLFTEDLAKTYAAAAEKYGIGSQSPVQKELAAVGPLIKRIRQERFQAMRNPTNLAEDFGKAFLGRKLSAGSLGDGADMFKKLSKSPADWAQIKAQLNLAGRRDDDPEILQRLKDWVDVVGREPKPQVGPEFVPTSKGHFYVLKGWEGMDTYLQCQIKGKK